MNGKLTLSAVLRLVGALIIIVVLGEYLVLDELLLPPLVVAALVFGLSFAASAWPVATAWVAIVICVLVPAGAIAAYLRGELALLIPVFDVVVFAWLLWTSVRTLRSLKQPSA